jgi:hypothetical protein
MIFKLIKVLVVGFFTAVYLVLGLIVVVAEMQSVPWPGY